jgi:uncharacterized protein
MPGFESLSLEIVLWVVVVTAFSGFVQGALGLGYPMIATPLIALTADMRTAIILVLLPCLAAVTVNVIKSGSLREVLAEFWMMPVFMLVGAAIGTRLFIAAPWFPYSLLLAAMIIIYLNLDRLGRSEWPAMRKWKKSSAASFAVIAGMSEGTANVAAAPLLIYFLGIGLAPAAIVQGMNMCFLVGKSTQFVTLATYGGVAAAQWLGTLPLAAIATLTVISGIRVRNRLDAVTYRLWLRRALFVMAVILLAQYAYGRWFV